MAPTLVREAVEGQPGWTESTYKDSEVLAREGERERESRRVRETYKVSPSSGQRRGTRLNVLGLPLSSCGREGRRIEERQARPEQPQRRQCDDIRRRT